MRKKVRLALIGIPVSAVGYVVASFFVPALLLFPHSGRVDGVMVYSEEPLSDDAARIIRASNALLATSDLYRAGERPGPVFLTQGGWRWLFLSFDVRDAFAQTRPIHENVIVNRSDFRTDTVFDGPAHTGERSLSGVIAHEQTHTLIRRRYGLLADRIYPFWVREGYCDHIAQSSSLSDAEAADLRSRGLETRALAYYDARRRVEAALRSNGGSVEDLFQSSIE